MRGSPRTTSFPPVARSSSAGPKSAGRTGTRFARRGIQLDALHTREDIADAIAKVIVFEYNALTPEQRTDSALVQQIHDLEFIVYPLHGFPLRSLAERRAMQHEAMRWVLDLPAADRPPRPTEAPREGWVGFGGRSKRLLWTAR